MTNVKKRDRSLLEIDINYRNWSWLLNPSWPSIQPTVPVIREMTGSAPLTETVEGKDDTGASAATPLFESPLKRGPKSKLKTRENWSHNANSSLKGVAPEPSSI